MTYVAQTDGGGTTDASQRLPIADVLNATGLASGDTKDSLVRIINAVPISSEDTMSSISTAISAVTEKKQEVDSVYNTYFQTLSETGSKRLNTSQGATDSEEKLRGVSSSMDSLEQALEELNNEDIEAVISEYNTKLAKLKTGAQLKLLRMRADEINAQAQNGTSRYAHARNVSYEGMYSYPNDYQVDRNTWRHYNSREAYTVDYYPPSNTTRTPTKQTRYKGTYTDFKYLNYWGTVNSIDKWYDFWPFNAADDDVNDLISRYNENQIPLPY